MKKRTRPSKHVRRVRTKKGRRAVVVNRKIKKRPKQNFGMGVFAKPYSGRKVEVYPVKDYDKRGRPVYFEETIGTDRQGKLRAHYRHPINKPSRAAFENRAGRHWVGERGFIRTAKYGREERRLQDKRRIK